MKARRYIVTILCALALAAPLIASAQGTFVPLANSGIPPKLQAAYNSKGLGDYINQLFLIALSVGAMLAVLRLVYAGYIYMVSGIDSAASTGKAKTIIGNVVFGLFLLLGIYLILYQINPDILKLNIT